MLKRNITKRKRKVKIVQRNNSNFNILTSNLVVDESDNDKRFSNPFFQLLFVIVVLIVSFLSYVLLKPYADLLSYKLYPKIICVSLVAVVGVIFFFYHRGRKKVDDYLIFFLIEAFIIHLMYMLYTDGGIRQHDVWTGNECYGHEGYAYSFYENESLPNHHNTVDTAYQFYHPPFNAFIQGNFMRLFEKICWNSSLISDEATLYKSCQILSVLYTSVSTLFLVKTIKLTNLSKKYKVLACMFAVFYPNLIVESAELNNDNLSLIFQLMALYYFFRWYLEGHKYRDILPCGLFVGLAMAAKMSAASICLGMAVGFIIEFVRSIMRKKGALNFSQIIVQYFIFLLICAPIGLWYQVYAHVALGFPYNYVFDNLNSALYNGPRSWVLSHKPNEIAYYDSNNSGILYENTMLNFVVRFILPFYPADFMSEFGFASSWEYYSIQTFALKSSIFGEYSYEPFYVSEGFAFAAYFFLEIIYLMTWVYLIYSLFNFRKNKMGKDGSMMLILGAGLMLMLAYLCYKMPYGCSMDFRYIMPFVLVACYLFGKCLNLMEDRKTKFNSVYSKIYTTTGCLFLMTSFLFYCVAY